MFENLLAIFDVNNPLDFRCMSVFYELLAKLKDFAEKQTTSAVPPKIATIREYVLQNYQDPSLYVESLANKFSISTSYLRREFSKAYGISPINFLTSVRLKNAQNMLDSDAPSITEISQQCGFSSLSYFIQVFRKHIGKSPREYRQRNISIKPPKNL